MRSFIAIAVCLITGPLVSASPLTSIFVNGGSFATLIDVDADPAFVSMLTTSTADTFVSLTPPPAGTHGVPIDFIVINNTGTDWVGLTFALTPGTGTFTSAPSLSLGGAFMSSINGSSAENATLNAAFLSGQPTFFGVGLELSGASTLTLTPLIPEPVSAAVLSVSALGCCRRRR